MLLIAWAGSKEAKQPPAGTALPASAAPHERAVHQVAGKTERHTGGNSFRSEAAAAEEAVRLFTKLKLGQTRSLEDAKQDPEWQAERANVPSLYNADPAPIGPSTGQQSAEPAVKVGLSSLNMTKLSHNAANGAEMPAITHHPL